MDDRNLRARIEKLESEARRWKLMATLVLIGTAVMLIAAPLPAQHESGDVNAYAPNKLEAHDFTLVGRDDKAYGRFYIKDNQPTLEFYDRNGKTTWSAPNPPNGGFTPVKAK